MTAPIDRVGVALTVEALAQQRARAGAPTGTAVVAGREIAGRLRGGVEWRPEHGLSVAVIARPVTLEPSLAGLPTLAAALAARGAVADLYGAAECSWPDAVETGTATMTVRVGSIAMLGPGRVEAAVLVVRVGSTDTGPWTDGQLADSLVDRLRDQAALLDQPEQVRGAYVDHCSTLGTRVRVGLLPNGACRGQATDVRADGCLVVTTASGAREAIAMSSTASIEKIS